MSLGVSLTQEDLEAVRELFIKRWSAEITNWKERDTDFCMWFVRCPDKNGIQTQETGQKLAEVIDRLLQKVLD